MIKDKQFWITMCLANLCILALLGTGLRSKILFTIPFLDYRNLLSAHSHFAFAGWAGLALITLLIHEILPPDLSKKKVYAWVLVIIQISAIGMALVFPVYGYNAIAISFSTLYMAITVVFAFLYSRDLLKTNKPKIVKILALASVCGLVLSYLGTLGLIYILASKSGNSILYRDSIYTFLHFQYNGFFTLAVFALFYNRMLKQNLLPTQHDWVFVLSLCASVIPSLFLALLWHNSSIFYVFAFVGCVLILVAALYFCKIMQVLWSKNLFAFSLASKLALFAALSFILKMLLNAGTIIPSLGNAVYGDRPVIIGFLHLVFLGFLSFYLLAVFIEEGIFSSGGRIIKLPVLIFSLGIFLNEIFLFVQGLIILFDFNSGVFKWLLWFAALILFAGSLMMFIARLQLEHKKRTQSEIGPYTSLRKN